MSSLNPMNNSNESSISQSHTKNNILNHNSTNLIESIPKLNLQSILNPEKNNSNKSRNNKILLDKHKLFSSKNNINFDNSNKNSDYEDEKKFETDNNFSINCHNNIFDFYELDKNDTNNSTSLESKKISSISNNNKKNMINKSVRKKRIINLKSFLNERKLNVNKKYYLDKFIFSIRNVFIRKSFTKLYNNIFDNNFSLKLDKIKLENSEGKNRNKEKNEDSNDIVVNTQIKMMDNNDCINYNNLSDSHSCNNYFYYIEQLSARYNREREENIFNILKYKPTNVSFVINNFSKNNNIFGNIQSQFELIKENLKINNTMQNQILLYKKYYGDIEAINEEENESEEIKNRKSSRRNEDNSLNDALSFDDNLDFSVKKMLNNIKLKNNKNIIKKDKSRLFNINPPIYDNCKIRIEIPTNIIDKISEINNNLNSKMNNNKNINKYKNNSENLMKPNNISKLNLMKFDRMKKGNKNNIIFKPTQSLKKKKKENNSIASEENLKKIIFNVIVLFLFIIIFLSKNFKKA